MTNLLEWKDLPPGAVAETVTFHGGKQITFYRIPAISHGPVLRRDERGRFWAYMYSYFVFYWYAGESRVEIYHGTIGGPNNFWLPWSFNIDSGWDPAKLVERGKRWAREHCGQFEKKGRRHAR